MTHMSSIRKRVLRLTQTKLATIAGVSQGTVSRWESGENSPSILEVSRIREHARDSGLAWEDAWLFDGLPEGLMVAA